MEGGLVCRPELKTALRKLGSEKNAGDDIFLVMAGRTHCAGRCHWLSRREIVDRGHKKTGPEDPVSLIQLDQSGPTFT